MAFHNVPPNGFPDLPDVEELEAVIKDVTNLKTSVAGLSEDVSYLSDNKANQITIAPFFNPETAYEVGDLVYYNGLSYRCTNAHEGEWDADDFAATTISNELASLMSGLTSLLTAFPSGTAQVRNLIVNGTGFNNAGADIFDALPIDNVNKFVYGLHIADGTRAFFGVVYGQQNYASIIIVHYNGAINVQTFANGAWTQKTISAS